MSDQPLNTCPNCGGTTPPGATFCPTCGQALAPGAPGPGGTSGPTFPRPPLSDQDVRNWAMGAHLSAFIGAMMAGLGSFAGPLVVWLIRRDDNPFIAEHAREALNFNITIGVAVLICLFFGVITLGIGFLLALPALLAIGALWLYGTIMGTMAASRGEMYRYPLTVRLVS